MRYRLYIWLRDLSLWLIGYEAIGGQVFPDGFSIYCIKEKEEVTEPQPIRLHGTLIRLNEKGFGFIHTANDGDYYVHISNMRHRAEWSEGQEVSFVPREGKAGKAPPVYDVVAILKKDE